MTTDNETTITQVAQPKQATKRTFVQTFAGTILAILTFVAGLSVFAPQFLEAVAPVLPDQWLAFATAGVAIISTVAATIARVMAIPGVNEWLHKLNLSAEAN